MIPYAEPQSNPGVGIAPKARGTRQSEHFTCRQAQERKGKRSRTYVLPAAAFYFLWPLTAPLTPLEMEKLSPCDASGADGLCKQIVERWLPAVVRGA